MSRKRAASAAMAIACVLAGTVTAAAQAAPTWLAPETLSQSQTAVTCGFLCTAIGASAPNVGMSASGEAVAVWARRDSTNTYRVQAAFRPPGSAWSAVQDVGISVSYAGFLSLLAPPPSLAVDAQGDAIVAFAHPAATGQVIQTAFRPAGGVFGAPTDLSGGGQAAQAPVVAMNNAGAAAAAWVRSNGTNNIVQAAVRPAGGSFGAAQDLSATGRDGSAPAIAIDAAGGAAVVWLRSNGTNNIAQAAVRPAGGSFGAAQDLSAAGQDAVSPAIAVDPAGRATVVWARSNGTNTIIQARARDTTGSFTSLQDLSETGQDASTPAVTVDSQNTAVAVWYRNTSTGLVVQSSNRPSGGSFGAAQSISAPGTTSTIIPLQVAGDAAGNTIAVWMQGGSPFTIQAARRPVGGAFGGVATISPQDGVSNGYLPRVALDSAGDAVAAFLNVRSDYVIQAAGFDAAAPQQTLSVPGSGVAGAPLAMSAATSDVWTPVTTTWSFGDGSSATGNAVSHAFASGGTYTITATSSDAVGNSTTASRTIQVSNPPVVVPPTQPPPGRITITLGFAFSSSTKTQTKFTSMTVKGFPSGSTVTVTCIKGKCPTSLVTKKKKGKKTTTVAKPLVFKNAKGTIKLSKVISKALKAGTRIRIDATKAGMIGATKILEVGKRKAPKVTTQCLPVGSTKPQNSCS